MKQSPVELLLKELDEEYDIKVSPSIKKRYMEMEKSEIPIISDKEIKTAANRDDYFKTQVYAFIEGAKWYRKELKKKK